MNITSEQLNQIKEFLEEHNIVDLSKTTGNAEPVRFYQICYSSDGAANTLTLFLDSYPGDGSWQENQHLVSELIRKFFNGYQVGIDIPYPKMCPDVYVFPLDEIAHQNILTSW